MKYCLKEDLSSVSKIINANFFARRSESSIDELDKNSACSAFVWWSKRESNPNLQPVSHAWLIVNNRKTENSILFEMMQRSKSDAVWEFTSGEEFFFLSQTVDFWGLRRQEEINQLTLDEH